jgi:hypothetical protein
MSSSCSCAFETCGMRQLYPSTRTKQQYTMTLLGRTRHPADGRTHPAGGASPSSCTQHPLCVLC